MKVLVCGSRGYPTDEVIEYLDNLYDNYGAFDIIQGGCPNSPDETALKWSQHRSNIGMIEYPAEWGKYGLGAGPIRNAKMIERMVEWDEETFDTLVVCFWDGKSRGTRSTFKLAVDAGLDTDVIIRRAP